MTLVTFLGGFALLIGVIGGFVLSDARLRNALFMVGQAVRRRHVKARLRRNRVGDNASPVFGYRMLDTECLPPIRRERAHPRALEAAKALRAALPGDLGERLAGIYLFGSRARGDWLAASDVDIAVVVADGTHLGLLPRWRILRATFQLLLSYGLYPQVHIVSAASSSKPYLAAAIDREGIRV